MVSSKDRGPTTICRFVRPRWNRGGECFQKEPGHESKFVVAQDGSEPLELWVGFVRGAYTGGAVRVLSVGIDQACDLSSRSVVEEHIVKIRNQGRFGGDVKLEQRKYRSLRRWLVNRD